MYCYCHEALWHTLSWVMMSSLPLLKIRYLIKILNGLKALLLVSKYGYCNFYKLTILYCIWIKRVRKKSERQIEIDICIWFCLSLFISSYWRDKEKGKERERVMERKRRIYICSVCFLSRSLAHTLFLCLFNYLVGYKRAEIWFLWLPPDFFRPPALTYKTLKKQHTHYSLDVTNFVHIF